ncbi:hypothetical protein KL864_18170 [Mycolicibacterium goodii]|uniref:hypothetical protein n=1 Tax=Mycolicibacterium goodii TaxID=134601 RepID=UPI001BDBBD74|nr:hypothetical protein [Mycolicibacterium goodii]MBU8817828.1 hypothetical protein [Mycolicibacterium goodii]
MADDRQEPALSEELELAPDEALVLTAFRLAMMDADIAAESSASKVEAKCRDRDAEVLGAIHQLRNLPSAVPAWVNDFRSRVDLASRHDVHAALVVEAGGLGAHIASRPRSLMVLIDAVLFDPWSGKGAWNTRQREEQLSAFAETLTGLQSRDVQAIERECGTALREVRRRSTNVGETTASALGRLPGRLGDTLTSAVVWLKSYNADVVRSAVRAELMTRLVVIEAEHDEEKAKRVVQSLQELLAVVAEKQQELVNKLQEMRRLNALLSNENRELRRQLIEERERTQLAEIALQAALDHIAEQKALPTAPRERAR